MPVFRTRRALGASAAVLLLLAACGKKAEYQPEVQRATYSSCLQGFKAKAPATIPASTVDAKSKGYCQCVLDGLQSKVPEKDFLRYDQLLATQASGPEADKLRDQVMGVVNVCLQRMPDF
ncbi:hypothetical protein A9G00_05725 [Achromobacter xylosoxidans]|uniref:hypothetical protein n=1 Tax=Achromobacter ruhlandii TaxID=72557 RepID=UPI00083A735B|nr:hypothetical protein [Achromobacter ruhlandii]OCZ67812.1 hypothetical protein A7P23_00565 [Achromobacter xylosoxidans]OCZ70581.1 hypothetical protein A9G00_05725 [Achromobacter xylosoxidans]